MASDGDLTTWVLNALRAHPHDDTPARLAALVEAPVDEVAGALEALREIGFVFRADGHWQLTSMGWRGS